MHAGGFEEGGAVAEAAEGVVVAGAEDDLHASAHEAGECLVEQVVLSAVGMVLS